MGKSTLCAGLAQWLTETGLRVDHFCEEEILTRPQFAAVAEEFKATGIVELATLIAAASDFVDAVVASGDDVVIADALMPFVPTLLAMGHCEETIDVFMSDLAAQRTRRQTRGSGGYAAHRSAAPAIAHVGGRQL